jgi:cupin domain
LVAGAPAGGLLCAGLLGAWATWCGEIDMMLDDTVVHVKAGDVVIQQATNHAWINRSTRPCRVLFVLMDSKQP